MYFCKDCNYKKLKCDCTFKRLDNIVSGMMTQSELDFAKENRERIAESRKKELEKEKEYEKLWEKRQEKLIEQNMKLALNRNQDKNTMILLRKLKEGK